MNEEFDTVDITVISPDGEPITVVITGRKTQLAFMIDLRDNCEEYTAWLNGGSECGGPLIGGRVH